MRLSGCTLETATSVTASASRDADAQADLIRSVIAAMRWDMSMARLLTILARFESRSTPRAQGHHLPRLLVLSDDTRGYPITRQLALWPTGAAFIERTFGRQAHMKAKGSASTVRLATCSPCEARAAKLDGLHWPQKRLAKRVKSSTKGLIETASAHRGLAIATAMRGGIDAILVSTAFASDSPSASSPVGPVRLAMLQRAFPRARLYALGGITHQTAKQLKRTRIYGVGLVSFKMQES